MGTSSGYIRRILSGLLLGVWVVSLFACAAPCRACRCCKAHSACGPCANRDGISNPRCNMASALRTPAEALAQKPVNLEAAGVAPVAAFAHLAELSAAPAVAPPPAPPISPPRNTSPILQI